LLTFSFRYERMVSREPSYTISCRCVSTLSTSMSTWNFFFFYEFCFKRFFLL
jgi:hypothetical protein